MERGLLMATVNRQGNARDGYFKLVQRFPLRPIRSDGELDEAVRMVDSLLARRDLAPEEEDYLEVLGDLVEQYESEAHPMAPVSDAEMLRHLIEAKGVSQTQISDATGIADSTISEVLKGKRSLNRGHIGKLAKYFSVSPDVFAF
jgi:HTH-type transcriptional regulator / antitoxin HigA